MKVRTLNLVGSIIQHGNDKLLAVKEILDNNSIEDLNNIKAVLRKCPADKYDKFKDLINNFTNKDASIKMVKLR